MQLVSIDSLTPETAPSANASIRAIVTLSWPYSSSTKQCALLLADPDFRLRNRQGQVRVRFAGASAEAVAKSRVGIGDEVLLRLDGAVWTQHDGHVRTPGRSIDGELQFRRKLRLTVVRPEGQNNISVDAPTSPRSPTMPGATMITTPLSKAVDTLRASGGGGIVEGVPIYSSPAFAKRLRLSGESFLDSAYDPFIDAELEVNRVEPSLHGSFGSSRQWRYAEKTPSPVKEAALRITEPQAEQRPLTGDVHPLAQSPSAMVHLREDIDLLGEAVDSGSGEMTEPSAFYNAKDILESASRSGQDVPNPSAIVGISQPQESLGQSSNITSPLSPPRLQLPQLQAADGTLQTEVAPVGQQSGPSNLNLQPVPSSALPLPFPFPADGPQQHFGDVDIQTPLVSMQQVSASALEASVPATESQTQNIDRTSNDSTWSDERNMYDTREMLRQRFRDDYASDTEADDELEESPTIDSKTHNEVLRFETTHTVDGDEDENLYDATPPSTPAAKALRSAKRESFDHEASAIRNTQLSRNPGPVDVDDTDHTLLEEEPTSFLSQLPNSAREAEKFSPGDFGLDGTTTTAAEPKSARQVERDEIMAQTYKSLFGFQTSPEPQSTPASATEAATPIEGLSGMATARLAIARMLPSQDLEKPTFEAGNAVEEQVAQHVSPQDRQPTFAGAAPIFPSCTQAGLTPTNTAPASVAEALEVPSSSEEDTDDEMPQVLAADRGAKPEQVQLAVTGSNDAANTTSQYLLGRGDGGHFTTRTRAEQSVESETLHDSNAEVHSEVDRSRSLDDVPLPPVTEDGLLGLIPLLGKGKQLDNRLQHQDTTDNEAQEEPKDMPVEVQNPSEQSSEAVNASEAEPATDIKLPATPVQPAVIDPESSSPVEAEARRELPIAIPGVLEYRDLHAFIDDATTTQRDEGELKAVPSRDSFSPSQIYSQLSHVEAEAPVAAVDNQAQIPEQYVATDTDTSYPSLPPPPVKSQFEQARHTDANIPQNAVNGALLPTPEPTQIESDLPQTHDASEDEMSNAQSKTPVMKSLATRLSNVPDVISAWFSPRRSSRISAKRSRQAEAEGSYQSEAAVRPEDSHDMVTGPVKSKLLEQPKQQIHQSDFRCGISTSLGYYTSLSTLDEQLNPSSQQTYGHSTVDVLAVVTDPTKTPERAKGGPRDFYTIFRVTDASMPNNTTTRAEAFRPWKAKLPVADVGDVVLLRGFTVKSRKHQAYLLSTDASAWCVWRHSDSKVADNDSSRPTWARKHLRSRVTPAREEMKGPPVELGEEERKHAHSLREWWTALHGGESMDDANGEVTAMNGLEPAHGTAKS